MINWGDVPTWLAVFAAVGAGGVAGWQLRLQRIQLREQQQVLADQTRMLERQQAEKVDVQQMAMDSELARHGLDEGLGFVNVALAINGSSRPIRNVACFVRAISVDADPEVEKLADVAIDVIPAHMRGDRKIAAEAPKVRYYSHVEVIRAGGTAGFTLPLPALSYSLAFYSVRFTDDAGLHWQIDPDMHLEKLPNRDDW